MEHEVICTFALSIDKVNAELQHVVRRRMRCVDTPSRRVFFPAASPSSSFFGTPAAAFIQCVLMTPTSTSDKYAKQLCILPPFGPAVRLHRPRRFDCA